MPLYDFKCPKCSWWRDDVLAKHDEFPPCEMCATPMERLVSLVAPPVFARPQSASGAREWAQKERARLEKRSVDYDNGKKGKQEREEQVHKLRKNGTIPEGWSA